MEPNNNQNQYNPNDFNLENPGFSTKPKKEGVVGPIIGSIVIIILLLLAGLYYWGYLVEKNNQQENLPTEESMIQKTPSAEEDLSQMEADIQAEDFSDIDESMQNIDAEFDAELQ